MVALAAIVPTAAIATAIFDALATAPATAAADCTKVNVQLALYCAKKGIFARAFVFEAAEEMPAYMWWDSYGSSVPELQTVACMVLAQPGSASICECINSEFAFIKDHRRNRFCHEKANMLCAMFHNLRLKKRMNALAIRSRRSHGQRTRITRASPNLE